MARKPTKQIKDSGKQPQVPSNRNASSGESDEESSEVVESDFDQDENYWEPDGEESGDDDEDEEEDDEDDDEEDDEDVEEDKDDGDDEDEFELQSSDDSDDTKDFDDGSDSSVDENQVHPDLQNIESQQRFWNVGETRELHLREEEKSGELIKSKYMHIDDLSSDDEDNLGNTIGRVPLHWYDAFDHIGYNIGGSKLMKREGKDRIDLAIQQKDDKMASRTVYDMYNDRDVVLTDRELEIIRRIQAGAFPHPEFNDTPDYVDYFTHEKEIMPLSAVPERKSSFVPSKWEMAKVMKIARAIKEGRYKFGSGLKQNDTSKIAESLYLIWNDAEDEVIADSKRYKFHLPAPKMPLPGHGESYNPPEEYLLSEEELKKYNDLDPEDRPSNFVPKKHSCLRHVGAYQNFVKERFERCLDLYLCPRKLKQRLNIDPETLVPKLPHPRELKPFPNTLCLQFLGHSKGVRSISVSPDGQYLASGSEDGTIRLWEVDTCLCRFIWQISNKDAVTCVSWNPDADHPILAAVCGNSVLLITTGSGNVDSLELAESQLSGMLSIALNNKESVENNDDSGESSDSSGNCDNEGEGKAKVKPPRKMSTSWIERKDFVIGANGFKSGPRVQLTLSEPVTQISWHHKGDYLVVLSPSAGTKAVSVHQISKGKSQFPFSKSPGLVQSVCFHPFLPCLITVTQQHVKLFHLIEQRLIKKLLSGCKWLSSIDIHHSGDHIVVGSYDRRVVWFDLDLASTPYKTLKFHEKAVRDIKFHRRYPLFASASDDGSVHVFHSMVYSDFMRSPLIVPLKVLKGHGVIGNLGVLSIAFHPRQPWIFTAGADGVINLYQDI